MGDSPRICVIGAGIMGLSSAAAIIERVRGANVTIVADRFTADTTSHGAFGIWMPYLVGSTPVTDLRRWSEDTLQHMLSLANSAEATDAGCLTLTGYCIYTKCREEPVWKDIVPFYRNLKTEELAAYGPQYRYGYCYSSAVAEGRFYLPWLVKRLRSAGVNIVRKKIYKLDELHGYDVVVNCTGLGSGTLSEDGDLVPVQGQLIRVHAPWVKHFLSSSDEHLYIFPGIDSVVLGGSIVEGSSDVAINQSIKSRILEGCAKLMPSLRGCQVLEDWVGIRPGRSRVRLEKETVTSPRGKIKVVHNYGHGGAGITLHWGCALDTAKLVQESLAQSNL